MLRFYDLFKSIGDILISFQSTGDSKPT
eukprot:COSAG01_NODE_56825_length_316_cov_0.695853_2_plen_27_part_01